MELYYKDKLHLMEKGYKKLANSFSEILKGPKKDLHHYPNITYDRSVIRINTHFPPLPTKSMLSTTKVYTKNLTTTTLTPRYKYALLKNIGATKAKENQMLVTTKNRNDKINKKVSTRTTTFSSPQNTATPTIINSNNNTHNNDKNNSSNSKENNNTLITIVLQKTDTKFNFAAIKEEKAPVPKKALPRENINTEKYPQMNQIHLAKLKNGKLTRELEPDNSFCVACFVQNPSMLWTYVMNTCKLRYIFTNFFRRFLIFIIFFSFLFRHFTIVDDPPFNLNFYNYSTIVDDRPFNLNFYNYSTSTRTFSRTYSIDFYEKYIFKHETLWRDLENSHIILHSKKI